MGYSESCQASSLTQEHKMSTQTLTPGTTLSPKQEAFLSDLLGRKDVGTLEVPEDLKTLTKKEASALIDALLKRPNAVGTKAQPKTDAFDQFAPGQVYMKDGTVYRVHKSQTSGRLYVKKLTVTLFKQNGTWSFVAGGLGRLIGLKPVSLAEAAQFGLATGVCAICGRELTVQESIDRGIGPVCFGKF